MFKIDSPHIAPAKPPYAAPGISGYWQDTDPIAGTEVTQDFMNHVQEELCGLVINAGLSLSKADDTLLVSAIGGAAAIKSNPVDAVTTNHIRAVISSLTSKATGSYSVIVGSRNVELADTYAIGGGYSAAALVPSGANQHLTWKITSNQGSAYFAGGVAIGGDVNTLTGIKCAIIAANGAIDFDYTDGGTGGGEYTINKPTGRGGSVIVGDGWNLGIADERLFLVNNNLVDASSIILCSAGCGDLAASPKCGIKTRGAGWFQVFIQNDGAAIPGVSGVPLAIFFDFVVFNPC